MRKSSIYLTDQLKQDLAALADRSGRPEAELIRHAIARLVAVSDTGDAGTPTPPPPRPQGPHLVGVGLGPGDPRQVTYLATDTLLGADRVFAVSWTARSISRAETVARAVAPTVPVERLTHDITADEAGRRDSLAAAAQAIVAALDAAEVVAVVTLGDPTLWSVFPDLAAAVSAQRPHVPVAMVPGIPSYQALAATTSTALARTGQRMVVVDGPVSESDLQDPSTTVVIYKGSPEAAVLRRQVEATERGVEGARVGELIGQAGERIDRLDRLGDGAPSYLATVLLPASEDRP